MGNLDKKRKLEDDLKASSNLSEEQRKGLQEEMNRVQKNFELKQLQKKKTGKKGLKKLKLNYLF